MHDDGHEIMSGIAKGVEGHGTIGDGNGRESRAIHCRGQHGEDVGLVIHQKKPVACGGRCVRSVPGMNRRSWIGWNSRRPYGATEISTRWFFASDTLSPVRTSGKRSP